MEIDSGDRIRSRSGVKPILPFMHLHASSPPANWGGQGLYSYGFLLSFEPFGAQVASSHLPGLSPTQRACTLSWNAPVRILQWQQIINSNPM